MKLVSSSATLLLKIFFPTFWIVFFGAFTFGVLLAGTDKSPLLGQPAFKIGVLVFYLCGLFFLWFFFLGLKRIEIDDAYIYTSNYFRTIRYPFEAIDKIVEHHYPLLSTTTVTLKKRGVFGARFRFIQSRARYVQFMRNNEGLKRFFVD